MSRDADPLREARERWHDRAAAWVRHAEWVEEVARPVTGRLLASSLRGRVLEVACGTGVLTERIARRSEVTEVVALDLAPGMIEETIRRTAGLPQVRTVVGDAVSAALPPGPFDAAVCRYGLMLMPDPVAAAARVRRELVPGGTFHVAVWTGSQENPLLSLPAKILADAAGERPDPSAKGPMTLGAPGALGAVLAAAGFESIEVARVEQAWEAPDVETLLERIFDVSGTAHRLLSELGDRAGPARDRVRESLAPWRREGGRMVVPGASWVAVARRA